MHERKRRLPRLRPSGDHAVPLHERPGALLHWISAVNLGVPVDPAPMDFSAWFEVYLWAARWHIRWMRATMRRALAAS